AARGASSARSRVRSATGPRRGVRSALWLREAGRGRRGRDRTVAEVGSGPGLALPRSARRGSLDSALRGRRPVYFPEKGGSVDTPVYGRDELSSGVELAGPAVTEERASTAVRP